MLYMPDTFYEDLKLSHIYEIESLKYIDYDSYKIKKGYFKDYDIETLKNNIMVSYEVKCDRLSYKTRNICIEVSCNNKPSGLTTTKADYWIYFIIKPSGYDVYKFKVKQLIKIVKGYNKRNIGYNKKSECYLVPLNILNDYKIII